MDIHEATDRYERWLQHYMPLVTADLREKHRRMAEAIFPFMRATFYRWCQLWKAIAPHEQTAARVYAVGDLHVENFGTWRDAEGRLIWGINDFDEATLLPWSQDLVRLATSANLAITSQQLGLKCRSASDAILEGYREGIGCSGRPFVLEEENGWLRDVATSDLRDPTAFWRKMGSLPTARDVDTAAVSAIESAMPAPNLQLRLSRRVAGIGSLGRPRFVGVADWGGGKIAREAKAMAPSAWVWAKGRAELKGAADSTFLARAVRVPDPMMRVVGHWLVRRLAPHCTRIELGDLRGQRNEERLLHAMGFETANIHLGTKGARPIIRRELRTRNGRWLSSLAKTFAAAIERDWVRSSSR
jgi:uncharacterized protein (DUF2252 family)